MNLKSTAFITLFTLSIVMATAQSADSLTVGDTTKIPSDTSYWKKGGLASITFTQVSLTNWAAGGDNSISLNGFFSAFADYRKDKIIWNNSLELGYGLIRQGDGSADFEKTDDRINLVTQFGYKLKGDKLYWSTLLDFRTQFQEGVNEEGERISDFLAPAYLLISTGLDWKPNKVFSLTYGPVTGKLTFVLDQDLANVGAFGVDPGVLNPTTGLYDVEGKNARAELGSFVKAAYAWEVMKNVSYSTRLELFTNYVEDFGNIDVNWQNLIVMKVNDFLTVNWQTQLLYDDDVKIQEFNSAGEVIGESPKTQFKSVFGVGLAYNFGQTRGDK
ncbi:MAG: DUF3078 domain-containing protein [Cyclobacteriaceae bacterium]|nr:DUF3078 domain-containing protein [Cyclobacteriaceae bacterium HetDA_MAG_MS6]